MVVCDVCARHVFSDWMDDCGFRGVSGIFVAADIPREIGDVCDCDSFAEVLVSRGPEDACSAEKFVSEGESRGAEKEK